MSLSNKVIRSRARACVFVCVCARACAWTGWRWLSRHAEDLAGLRACQFNQWRLTGTVHKLLVAGVLSAMVLHKQHGMSISIDLGMTDAIDKEWFSFHIKAGEFLASWCMHASTFVHACVKLSGVFCNMHLAF